MTPLLLFLVVILENDLLIGLWFSLKGSEEEHIKQELQNVAEGVAASVLQSSTPSYHEPPIKVDEYAFNSKGEVSRNDEMKQQSTHFKVLSILFTILVIISLDFILPQNYCYCFSGYQEPTSRKTEFRIFWF